jgi:anionic cell wall polymer biosynthesis LytR-Cps2A-Psr (LCP) family protein
MINSLGTLAWSACGKLPYYTDTCGQERDEGAYLRAIRAFETTLGTLLGMDGKPGDLGVIDGTVTINPVGLTTLIDDLGGVNIYVGTKLYDKPCGPAGSWQQKTGASVGVPGTSICDTHNGYSVPTGAAGVANMKRDQAAAGATITWSQERDIAFIMQTGAHHMNGDWALAFARTRMYSSDFDRAARQQQLLLALRSDFDPCTIAPRIPSLIGHISGAFHTNLPLNNAADLQAWVNLAHGMLGSNVKSIVLNPRDADIAMPFVSGYPAVDPASWARIKYKVAHSLDGVPAAPSSGTSGGGGGGIC